MMILGWWLVTFVLSLFLIFAIVFIIYALKSGVNTEDAVRIDPIPDDSKKQP
ncbi:hypothetical protein [Metabacillus arenae]|uniref:Uncharacterized protein n=1 Tax=Metabacillus arenae TaxID=2771434 RepID=A0A926NDQ3_9BACI|nr:hypothetical protein [Metabacillus arenae]MBD1379614.1 hypothetical protein [Metabacillus arenae]